LTGTNNVVKPTRTYRSPHRAAQAQATRAAILDAAARLFCENGYAGTTMQAVAAEAGVAVESVYGLASKARLLELAHERVVVEGAETPLAQRPEFRSPLEEADQRSQLRAFAAFAAPLARPVASISRAFAQASATDATLAARWQEQEQRRLADMRTVVVAVASRGPLRPGLTVDSAAVTLWAALNWYTTYLVCEQTAGSDEDLAAWLEQTMAALLLP
jgi:AcrR family transcriptional regulator